VALQGEGVGVLSDINVQQTLKDKLGAHMRPWCGAPEKTAQTKAIRFGT
jgi:hypothetical protein